MIWWFILGYLFLGAMWYIVTALLDANTKVNKAIEEIRANAPNCEENKCSNCDGTGELTNNDKSGMSMPMYKMCHVCQGTGLKPTM